MRTLSEKAQRKALIRRFIQVSKKYVKAQEKARLANQHGLEPGDYSRCLKTNGVACTPCKEYMAQYMRTKWATDSRYREWDKAKKRKYKVSNGRERARKRNIVREYYTRKQIFDRDGYDCYLCHEPVDLTASHNMGQPGWELYPHVEHVIPLAKGGTDTLDNVKIAHAKCNMDKGTRLLPST